MRQDEKLKGEKLHSASMKRSLTKTRREQTYRTVTFNSMPVM